MPALDLDDVAPEAAAMSNGPVKTRELAGNGYQATSQPTVMPSRLADPAIAEAVERQTRAMRQLGR
ncbi:hypothetical protein [Streptomyces pseudovenezuelae]|uniref:hypothetical protein n=1 Tax=Streptomyces pseudovenezuelae TaxID=67350 RepID=UPI002E808D3D|nr:hypothetical protein [Streptomyces pseudovenezuelae]WUA93896.1 hypothetical protein OHO81_44135 [Streptomyces pseudovenezuelae]